MKHYAYEWWFQSSYVYKINSFSYSQVWTEHAEVFATPRHTAAAQWRWPRWIHNVVCLQEPSEAAKEDWPSVPSPPGQASQGTSSPTSADTNTSARPPLMRSRKCKSQSPHQHCIKSSARLGMLRVAKQNCFSFVGYCKLTCMCRPTQPHVWVMHIWSVSVFDKHVWAIIALVVLC